MNWSFYLLCSCAECSSKLLITERKLNLFVYTLISKKYLFTLQCIYETENMALLRIKSNKNVIEYFSLSFAIFCFQSMGTSCGYYGGAAFKCGRSDSSGERRSYCLHVPVFNLSEGLKGILSFHENRQYSFIDIDKVSSVPILSFIVGYRCRNHW